MPTATRPAADELAVLVEEWRELAETAFDDMDPAAGRAFEMCAATLSARIEQTAHCV